MANSLLTGISGLRGHQKMLEVIGNNLANLNTTAFKSSRALFSDLMYELQRGSTSSAAGLLGSVNAVQVGTGSRISLVDLNFSQGNLEATGQDLDVAIDGAGFFVASSGTNTYYTRAGSFSLDQDGYLVDASTGNLIKRFGTVGEPDGVNPSFQTAGDDRLLIPIGTAIPGKTSETISVSGNFPSTATGAVAQQLRLSTPLTNGGVAAAGADLLNNLDGMLTPYLPGHTLILGGTRSDGTPPVPSEIAVDDTTTVDGLIALLTTSYGDASFSLDSQGYITVEAGTTGPSSLDVAIEDRPGLTGNFDFTTHDFISRKIGKTADSFYRAVEIFDQQGVGHSVSLKFTKDDTDWNMEALIDPTEGTVIDGVVNGIAFNSDGSFQQVKGGGVNGDINLIVQFDNVPTAQTVSMYFGEPNSFEGLSVSGSQASLSATADGYEPGQLSDVQIDSDGTVFGLTSNGLMIALGQLAIASFRNVDGLLSVGNNYYQSSLASGEAVIGNALSGGRGAIRAAQLEGSNVDLALEFTRLIVAQRGFSANARTITVTDEVLKELTSIIR